MTTTDTPQLPEFCHALKGGGDEPASRRQRIAELQRQRRKRFKRVDFYADPETIAIIEALRTPRVDGAASAIVNKIVREWAAASGNFGRSARAGARGD